MYVCTWVCQHGRRKVEHFARRRSGIFNANYVWVCECGVYVRASRLCVWAFGKIENLQRPTIETPLYSEEMCRGEWDPHGGVCAHSVPTLCSVHWCDQYDMRLKPATGGVRVCVRKLGEWGDDRGSPFGGDEPENVRTRSTNFPLCAIVSVRTRWWCYAAALLEHTHMPSALLWCMQWSRMGFWEFEINAHGSVANSARHTTEMCTSQTHTKTHPHTHEILNLLMVYN